MLISCVFNVLLICALQLDFAYAKSSFCHDATQVILIRHHSKDQRIHLFKDTREFHPLDANIYLYFYKEKNQCLTLITPGFFYLFKQAFNMPAVEYKMFTLSQIDINIFISTHICLHYSCVRLKHSVHLSRSCHPESSCNNKPPPMLLTLHQQAFYHPGLPVPGHSEALNIILATMFLCGIDR